jgi:outer membrane autotransporter protein
MSIFKSLPTIRIFCFCALFLPNGHTSQDYSFGYVTDKASGAVYIVDPRTKQTISTVQNTTNFPFKNPTGVAISQDSTLACVADGGTNRIYYIDTPFKTPLWVATGFQKTPFPPSTKIDTSQLKENNLIFANYLNNFASLDLIDPFLNLDLTSLKKGLESAAPTRNVTSHYYTQIIQTTFEKILDQHLFQKRVDQHKTPITLENAIALNTQYIVAQSEEGTIGRITSPKKKNSSFWIEGFGQYSKIKPRSQTPNFTATAGGLLLGIDHSFLDTQTVGIGLAYAHSHLKDTYDSGSSTINQEEGFIYGNFQMGNWFLETAFFGGYYHGNQVRNIRIDNSSFGSTQAKIQGVQFSPHIEIGHDYWKKSLLVEVFTAFDYVGNLQKGMKENGSSSYKFNQKNHYTAFIRSESGLRFQERKKFKTVNLYSIQKFSYAFQKTIHTGSFTSYLIGLPELFTVTTLKTPQNIGIAELAFSLEPKKKNWLSQLSLQAELSPKYQNYLAILNINKNF